MGDFNVNKNEIETIFKVPIILDGNQSKRNNSFIINIFNLKKKKKMKLKENFKDELYNSWLNT